MFNFKCSWLLCGYKFKLFDNGSWFDRYGFIVEYEVVGVVMSCFWYIFNKELWLLLLFYVIVCYC